MPATSEKQRRFFGAVMGAKKGKPGSSGKAKDVAKHMSKDKIKDFLHKKGEAYTAGFLRKCAEEGIAPEALLKAAAEDSRLAAYLSNLLPFAGPSLYGVSRDRNEPVAAATGSGIGSLLGGAGGSLAGGAGGLALATIISALTKGRVQPYLAAGVTGALGGGFAGAGEGAYQGAKLGGKKKIMK